MIMISSQRGVTFAILILSVGIAVVVCGVAPVQKRSIVGANDPDTSDLKLRPSKRTFCNAFTGCAGKRSDPMVSNKPTAADYEYDQQQAAEGNEESIDDVIRDILAEARLYEALRGGSGRVSQQGRQVGFFPRQKRSVATLGKRSIKMGSSGGH